ncbi:MAG: hypothetical protein RL264_2700 [Bacteroidota bacterium]
MQIDLPDNIGGGSLPKLVVQRVILIETKSKSEKLLLRITGISNKCHET